jgi:hypothetical protein
VVVAAALAREFVLLCYSDTKGSSRSVLRSAVRGRWQHVVLEMCKTAY